jgi:hypothetical protein
MGLPGSTGGHPDGNVDAAISGQWRGLETHRLPGVLGAVEEPRHSLDGVVHRGVAHAPSKPPPDLGGESADARLLARLRAGVAAAETDARPEQAHTVDGAVDVAGAAVRDLHLVGAEALLRIGIDLGAEGAARQRARRRRNEQKSAEDGDGERPR